MFFSAFHFLPILSAAISQLLIMHVWKVSFRPPDRRKKIFMFKLIIIRNTFQTRKIYKNKFMQLRSAEESIKIIDQIWEENEIKENFWIWLKIELVLGLWSSIKYLALFVSDSIKYQKVWWRLIMIWGLSTEHEELNVRDWMQTMLY